MPLLFMRLIFQDAERIKPFLALAYGRIYSDIQ